MGRVEVITWSTKVEDQSARFANVRLFTYNTSGLELTNDFTEVSAGELGDGTTKGDGTEGSDNVMVLSTFAAGKVTVNGEEVSVTPDGYTYVDARIGTKDGTVITGLKGTKVSDNLYTLSYTTVDDPTKATENDWVQYKDSVSKETANNANVYLIFTEEMTAPLTIHYLTLSGDEIKDGNGNAVTKTVDAGQFTSATDVVTVVNDNLPNGYSHLSRV